MYYSTKNIVEPIYREKKLSPSIDIPSLDAAIKYISTLFYARYGVLAMGNLGEIVGKVQKNEETIDKKWVNRKNSVLLLVPKSDPKCYK
jgi:hypothetical protein